MEPEQVLKEFGLTETEAKVYLALLKLGETTVPEVVKKVKLYHANAYRALESLEKKGLVSHVKKEHILFYSALNPKKLFEILESKKEDLDSVFSLLNKLYQSEKSEREINILSGREGLKTVVNDIIAVGKDVFVLGSSLQFFSVMEHRAIQFFKELKRKNIVFKALVVDKEEIRKQTADFQKQLQIEDVRFYPEKYFSPVAINIYGDVSLLIIWEENPVIIRVKDKHIALTFKNYFEMIWKSAKK